MTLLLFNTSNGKLDISTIKVSIKKKQYLIAEQQYRINHFL